jgi:DNA-binding response OmpR family regulator
MVMPKILIAEDERDIRDLVTFSLKFSGFDVVQASNGIEAVEQAQAELPDLILMDVRMPKMTGYEACKQLKAIPTVRDIPVIFLSAKGQESEIQQGLEVGAEEYILKPFAPDELAKQVRTVLERVAQRKAQTK